MRSWILSLAGAVGALAFVGQSAVAEHTVVPVTPAALTIGSEAQFEGSGHAIVEVRHPHTRGRTHFYAPPHRRSPYHGSYWHRGPVYRYPQYRYRHPYGRPYYGRPGGGVYFYGPRVGIGIGW